MIRIPFLCLTTREYGETLLRKIKSMPGLTVLTEGEIPPLPDHCDELMVLRAASWPNHRCEHEQLIVLPPALVVDIRIQQWRVKRCHWQAEERFPPYWLTDVQVIHEGMVQLFFPFRAVSLIEGACLLAQHPRLGSLRVRSITPTPDQPWWKYELQVFFAPWNDGKLTADDAAPYGYRHHVALAGDSSGSVGRGIVEYTPVAKATAP